MMVTYLHADALGGVSAATNSSGAVVTSQAYSPFGAVRAGGGLPTTQDFTGQRNGATGLLDYGARSYDPALGRLIPSCNPSIKETRPLHGRVLKIGVGRYSVSSASASAAGAATGPRCFGSRCFGRRSLMRAALPVRPRR